MNPTPSDFLAGMSTSIWTHKFVAKVPHRDTAEKFFQVCAGLHLLGGNRAPYFSITAESKNSGGCLHEEVLRHFPRLAPVIALHLSAENGLPLHTIENGLYHLGCIPKTYYLDYNGESKVLVDYPGYNQKHVMGHFRISAPAADALRSLVEVEVATGIKDQGKRFLERWCAEQHPRWHAEAQRAIAILDTLIKEASA